MNLKVFTVPLDIKQPTSASDEWVVVAGDNGNEIHVILTDDGNPIDLTGHTILAIFSKPDGSTSEQDSWGNGITVVGEAGNEIVIDLWPSSFGTGRLYSGLVKCEIQVYYGESLENLVTSAQFTFRVRRAILNNETIEQTSEYPILSELIKQVTEIGQGIQPDWDQDDPTKSGYIKNKPYIPQSAEDVGALPDTTRPEDIGALPDTTTPADIGALPEDTVPADIGAIPASEKAAENGIATLDANGKVTAGQSSASYLPITGDTTLSSDHEGKTLKVTADATLTLGELADGCEVEIINYGASTVTLSGTLFVAGEGSATSCTIDENAIAVCKYMDSVWFVAGGVSV